jgi:hypothetical protein
MSKRMLFPAALIVLNLALFLNVRAASAEKEWVGTCNLCWGNAGTEPCCVMGCSATNCCTGPAGCQ